MKEEYEYQKPIENEDLIHKITLRVEGKPIGEASLEYRNSPFPFYYLQMIYIDQRYTGQGLGRDLLEQVNQFLDDHDKPGLLINSIDESSPVHGVYQRHGWQSVPDHEVWMGYKLDKIDPSDVLQAINAINTREMKGEKAKPEAA